MAKVIDGKAISAAIRSEIAEKVKTLNVRPGLAVILVGEDPASQVYVRNKGRACEEVGFLSRTIKLPEDTPENELLSIIDTLNRDSKIHGILVQLPVPEQINPDHVINAISPEKDVDAFHPINVGRIMTGNFSLAPCTPAGVMELLRRSGVEIAGKECVIIGRSNIVGKPQAMLMLKENATVTLCHSKTKDLAVHTKRADILVAAVGRPKMITGDMIKEGAAVIDVGINRLPDGKLCGDVDFDSAKDIAGYITPVPGGVGPMTITMLLKNTLTAAGFVE